MNLREVSENANIHDQSVLGSAINMVRRRSQSPFQMSLRVKLRKNVMTASKMVCSREAALRMIFQTALAVDNRPFQIHFATMAIAFGIRLVNKFQSHKVSFFNHFGSVSVTN